MYLPARGRNVIRAANYKVIDYIPDEWHWKPNTRYQNVKAGADYADGAELVKGMSRFMPIVYDSDDGESDDDESVVGSSDTEDEDVEDDVVIVRDDGGKILQMEEEDCDDGVNYWSDPTPNHQSLRTTLSPYWGDFQQNSTANLARAQPTTLFSAHIGLHSDEIRGN